MESDNLCEILTNIKNKAHNKVELANLGKNFKIHI